MFLKDVSQTKQFAPTRTKCMLVNGVDWSIRGGELPVYELVHL